MISTLVWKNSTTLSAQLQSLIQDRSLGKWDTGRRGPKGGVLKEGKGAQKGIISRSKLTRPRRLGHTDKNCKWGKQAFQPSCFHTIILKFRNHEWAPMMNGFNSGREKLFG